MKTTLPAPSPLAKTQSERLSAKIAQEIKRRGPLPFSEFMQRALYEPGLGYYSAGAKKFGAEGDFVTAPEISPLFSRCLANQCSEILKAIPDSAILEFGAGTGAMAKEILLFLAAQHNLPEKYYILELSADLRNRQQALLGALESSLFNRVQWLDHLPASFSGVVLANEVLDAMPASKFFVDQEIREFYVDYKDNIFCWELGPPQNSLLIEAVQSLEISGPYESEINLFLKPWFKSLSEVLEKAVVLIIDYGFPAREYYHPDRNRGTIMCHYQHRAHDNPLINVGIQDITAHVDFTAVAGAAYDNGFSIEGFVNQATFLINCGLMEFFPKESALSQYRVSQEIQKLISPSEMGELFKVMAVTKNFSADLCGFSQMNRLERL